MTRLILTIAVLLSLCATAPSQTTGPDAKTFDLTAVAPPSPVLKYQLLFDDLGERRPGNAAILYLQAVLLLGPEAQEQANKALAAYDAKDMKTFDSLAKELDRESLFQQLDLAARREQCDWQPPFREMGVQTLLPHLNPLLHGVTKTVKIRALRQIEQGKVDDALLTLRLGYELSDKLGHESALLSGVVSLAMTTWMNDCLVQLMNRPESPNLYWALAEFPGRQPMFRRAMDGERSWMIPSVPNLAKARAGEQLSADQWRAALEYVAKFVYAEEGSQRKLDPVGDASPETLREARELYAKTHHLSADEAAKIDPMIALGHFYFQQYQAAFDDMYKLRGLPYPLQLAKAAQHDQNVAKLRSQQRGNPFFQAGSEVHGVIRRYARADRQLAALMAVEAIRSYAAANGGKLPARLEDITDTPVPNNPATGKPFEYRVEKESAILADTKSKDTLTYTVTIRK